jgi:hypothetical protein
MNAMTNTSATEPQAGTPPDMAVTEASELAWDHWVQDVCATDFTPWWVPVRNSQLLPEPLPTWLADD